MRARSLNFHKRDEAMNFRLVWSEARENAAEAEGIFAECGAHPVFAGGGGVTLVEDEIDDFEHGRESSGEIGAVRNLEGNARFGERAFGADDALGDGGFGDQEGASDFLRGEAAKKAKSERDTRFGGKDRVTGNEDEAEKVVADVLVVGGVEIGFKIGHGGFLLGFEFATELFVFAFEDFVAAKVVHGAMLGGGHEPGTGIVRHAGFGPALECGDEGVLRELFGEADVANDASESGNDFGGLDSPDGVDDAMRISG